MDETKKDASYADFREAIDDYADHKGHDLLTDPEALALANKKAETEKALTHGERLRTAREQLGFTFQELAAKTGIAPEILAQLETGETLLPLGQMIRLSKVLSLKMSDMISTGEASYTIVRAGERQAYARFGETKMASRGYEYQSLAPGKKDRQMEPFIVTLKPASHDEPSAHDGQEFIYVLEGQMEVIIGDEKAILEPGDAVYYDSTTVHLVRAYGEKPAKILAVLVS